MFARNRHTAFAALLVLCSMSLWAQPPQRAAQDRPQDPPPQGRVPKGVQALRDVEYGRAGDIPLLLDLYVPEKAEGRLPLIVWIHGGAWLGGSKAQCPAIRFAARGYVVASVEYRLSPVATFPAQIQDCKAAIRWLRANAGKYHIDPDRVGAWGASAGGHLVALLGTAADVKEFDVGAHLDQSSKVQAVVDFFGPAELHTMGREWSTMKHDEPDSPESRLLGGPIQENLEKSRKASPMTYVSKNAPPFLIVHGDKDPLVPYDQSVRFEKALKEAGVEVSFYTVKGGGHGGFRDPAVDERVAEFFDKRLKADK
jgi:acetyl esterase/lipase